MAANSQSKIKLSKTPEGISPEPKQPWWTEECRRAVARARKARNLCDPSKGGISCDSNKAAWKEKENKKKRIVVKAKKMSMNKFINSLSSKTKSTKTWAFAKAWANGTRPPDLNSSPIKDPTTYQPIVIAKDKANILASQYDHHKESIPDDPKLEIKIAEKKIRSQACSSLNSSHQNERRPPSSRYGNRKSQQKSRTHTDPYRTHPAWGK